MLSGISIWQLLILLAIVVMIFGTKRLRNLGGDLGGALKDFRGAMKQGEEDEEAKSDKADASATTEHRVIDQEAEATKPQADKTTSHDHTS